MSRLVLGGCTLEKSVGEIWKARKNWILWGLRFFGFVYVLAMAYWRPEWWIILGSFILVAVAIFSVWGIALRLETAALNKERENYLKQAGSRENFTAPESSEDPEL